MEPCATWSEARRLWVGHGSGGTERTAAIAELTSHLDLGTTARTDRIKGRPAISAESCPFAILPLAPGTLHAVGPSSRENWTGVLRGASGPTSAEGFPGVNDHRSSLAHDSGFSLQTCRTWQRQPGFVHLVGAVAWRALTRLRGAVAPKTSKRSKNKQWAARIWPNATRPARRGMPLVCAPQENGAQGSLPPWCPGRLMRVAGFPEQGR